MRPSVARHLVLAAERDAAGRVERSSWSPMVAAAVERVERVEGSRATSCSSPGERVGRVEGSASSCTSLDGERTGPGEGVEPRATSPRA
jgi:hypothetical protein